MKKFMPLVLFIALASCATPQVVGTGFINGQAQEIEVRAYQPGLTAHGWLLILDGEEIGVFERDGDIIRGNSQIVQEYKEIQSRYGEFDAVQTINLHLFGGSTNNFRITLNGNLVGTITGNLQ